MADAEPISIPSRQVKSGLGSTSLAVERASIPGYSRERSLYRLAVKAAGIERVTEPYEQSPWVHIFGSAGESMIRTVRIDGWDKDPRDYRDAVKAPDSHPLISRIRKPSPLNTEADLWGRGYIHRLTDGEDFWVLTDDDEENTPITGLWSQGSATDLAMDAFIPLPKRIWSVRGKDVELQCSGSGVPLYWRIPWGSGTRNVPLASVVQFRHYDPASPLRGLGPMQVLANEFDLELRAKQSQTGMFDNGGTPSVWVTKKGPMEPSSYKDLQRKLHRRFARSDKKGLPIILDNFEDMNLQFGQTKPSDMGYEGVGKDLRQKVAGLTRLPEMLVGIMDRAMLRNFEAATKVGWEMAMLPELLLIEDVLNNLLLPRIDPRERRGVEVVRFDLSRIPALQDDNLDLMEEARRLVKEVPGISWHEALIVVGLEKENIQEGDRRYVPTGWVSLEAFDENGGSASPPPPEPAEPPDDGEDPDPPDGEDGTEDDAAKALERELIVQAYVFRDHTKAQHAEAWASQRGVEWLPERIADGIVLEQRPIEDFEPGSIEVGAVGEVTMFAGRLKADVDPILSLARGRDAARARLSRIEREDDSEAPDGDPDPAAETEAIRAMVWRSIANKAFEPWEPQLVRASLKFQSNYQRVQIERLEAYARGDERFFEGHAKAGEDTPIAGVNLTAADIEVLLLDVAEWNGKASERYRPELERIFAAASAQAAEEIGGAALSPQFPRAVEHLRVQTFKMVDHTNGTIREAVREALLSKFHESTSIGTLRELVIEQLPDLKASVKESFKDKNVRAQRIARTETGTAVNAARDMTFQEEGITHHEWLSSRDDATRDAHGPGGLDGKVVRIGDEFSPGLKYPLDVNADASQRINCRCLTLPVMPEDDEEDDQ